METWQSDKLEAENKRKAGVITLVINVLVFLFVYFMVVWKQPIPPLPQYGLELNLGFSDFGSGNTQTLSAPNDVQSEVTTPAAPGEVSSKPTESAVPNTQPASQAKPVTTPAKSSVEAVSKTPSTIKGSEKTTPVVKDNTPEKKANTPVTQPAKAEAEKTAPKVEEKPKVDQRALMGAGGTSGTGTQAATGSAQGSSDQRGDEGRPTGTVDGRALMGSGTGQGVTGPGAGYNLDLAGWDFASRPNIRDNVSTRNGRIVFKITVDDSGKVVQAIPLEYNVSNDVLAYYRTVVNQVSFKRQSGNATADYSTGKITFIIKVD
ncbi:energy transducer TonB [Belliella kenyensis]|uniref:Energy transducer TonB n=1 Tax=Belliella kenyensis TaxID=1472724 RepID=A0ABV8EJP5_9BACT|nr:energy transducer TonB [Belliella kenyensis]MCH7403760.1 energy transducer TonB [Belliella kenyensis]MDN3604436.1 energy transducer TonB [Belliella kenyensis]